MLPAKRRDTDAGERFAELGRPNDFFSAILSASPRLRVSFRFGNDLWKTVYVRFWDHLAGSGTLNNFQNLNFWIILHPTKGDSAPR